MAKQTKKTTRRTKVKDLSKSKKKLSAKEMKGVKGGWQGPPQETQIHQESQLNMAMGTIPGDHAIVGM
jgi:hypothetical protein